jgi:hypothetical protein
MDLEAQLLFPPSTKDKKPFALSLKFLASGAKGVLYLVWFFKKSYKEKGCVKEKKGEGSGQTPIHSPQNPNPGSALSFPAFSCSGPYGNPRPDRLFQ